MVLVILTRWLRCQYMAKTFKIFFFGTRRPMILKPSSDRLGVKVYKASINVDPGLTLTYLKVGQIWSKLLIVLIPDRDVRSRSSGFNSPLNIGQNFLRLHLKSALFSILFVDP